MDMKFDEVAEKFSGIIMFDGGGNFRIHNMYGWFSFDEALGEILGLRKNKVPNDRVINVDTFEDLISKTSVDKLYGELSYEQKQRLKLLLDKEEF